MNINSGDAQGHSTVLTSAVSLFKDKICVLSDITNTIRLKTNEIKLFIRSEPTNDCPSPKEAEPQTIEEHLNFLLSRLQKQIDLLLEVQKTLIEIV